jgi:hypothetical protein
MKYVFYTCLIFFCLTQIVLAADNTFRIRTLIGSDTIPPTTPANLTATPISTSQIDLEWDASTDNFLFGGYQVWRDTVQIATTTLTNYSDTGLTASTTYDYFVIAFDDALNYSSSSNLVSANTLSVVATSTPSTTTDRGTVYSNATSDIELNNLQINPTNTTADISFDTNIFTRATIRWGRTINYEIGYIDSNIFKRNHETTLTELQSGTVYELEIVLYRRQSSETLIKRLQFSTEAPADILTPPNVRNLKAVVGNDGFIDLSWNNPKIADFDFVRILSNDYFYPLDRTDGWLVYEGEKENIRDNRAFSNNRFYTVYVYDSAGNSSSGAVVYVTDSPGSLIIPDKTIEDDIFYNPYKDFDFSDVIITQTGETLPTYDGAVTIERQSETTIKIPYDSLPQNLKTIVMTIKDPSDPDSKFSFLLSINADRTAYEATFGQLPILGFYQTEISIFDYSSEIVGKTTGGLIVSDGFFGDTTNKVIEEVKLLINWPLISVTSLLILGILIFWWRRAH